MNGAGPGRALPAEYVNELTSSIASEKQPLEGESLVDHLSRCTVHTPEDAERAARVMGPEQERRRRRGERKKDA